MTDNIKDILRRMRPYLEASGAAVEVFFVDEDFGIVELLVSRRDGQADEDIRTLQYSLEQMLLQKIRGIRQVEFLKELPAASGVAGPDVPDLAEEELATLRAGTILALQILSSLEETLRQDAKDRTLREARQAEHFLGGPYPKWVADARERFEQLPRRDEPKVLLRKLRDIFPALDRTTRALSRVVDAERRAWENTEIPFRPNTAPIVMMEEARGDYCDLQRILTEMRPHLGDRTLEDFDANTEEPEKQPSRPTTHLLDRIFRDAATRHVRDVYIEVGESSATLKYRVGREIRPVVEFPRTLYRLLLARLKHLAALDVTERRRRQEGLICFSDTSGYKGLNVQVQTIPDHFAERVRLHLQLPAARGGRS